jgi:hypothetical protein
MKSTELIVGVLAGLIVAIVLAILGLVWNWTSGGWLIRALGGVTQADLADGLPLKLSQRVSEDTVSEAFAQCNSDETPVAGECIVVQGNGLMFNAGIQLNQEHLTGHDGYRCFYTGSPTVRAYAYCVNKKQIRIIPLGANP